MSARAFWTARWLLFEERFGPLIRAAARRERDEEAQLVAGYQRSVAALRKSTDGDR